MEAAPFQPARPRCHPHGELVATWAPGLSNTAVTQGEFDPVNPGEHFHRTSKIPVLPRLHFFRLLLVGHTRYTCAYCTYLCRTSYTLCCTAYTLLYNYTYHIVCAPRAPSLLCDWRSGKGRQSEARRIGHTCDVDPTAVEEVALAAAQTARNKRPARRVASCVIPQDDTKRGRQSAGGEEGERTLGQAAGSSGGPRPTAIQRGPGTGRGGGHVSFPRGLLEGVWFCVELRMFPFGSLNNTTKLF